MKEIDETLWGLRKGILYTIGARTSHGKTSFSVHILKHLADSGLRVLYFTLETSREQLIEKIFCNVCRVNSLDLLHGKAGAVFSERAAAFSDWVDRVKVLIDDKNGYDFNTLLDVVNTVGADFVIVDYVQMISTKGFRTKTDAIEEYVRKFAELAATKRFGAIIISQINRSGVDDPTMSKFKWAGVLEEHCLGPDTMIYDVRNDKYHRIEDIYNNQNFFPVKTFNFDNCRIEYREPNRIFCTGELDCYEVTTKSGKKIIASHGSKFYNGKWVKVENLSVGDKIYVDT